MQARSLIWRSESSLQAFHGGHPSLGNNAKFWTAQPTPFQDHPHHHPVAPVTPSTQCVFCCCDPWNSQLPCEVKWQKAPAIWHPGVLDPIPSTRHRESQEVVSTLSIIPPSPRTPTTNAEEPAKAQRAPGEFGSRAPSRHAHLSFLPLQNPSAGVRFNQGDHHSSKVSMIWVQRLPSVAAKPLGT